MIFQGAGQLLFNLERLILHSFRGSLVKISIQVQRQLFFQVPYGCLVPINVDNLLVGGRCVAGDKVSHAAMRNMMACTVSGQVPKIPALK